MCMLYYCNVTTKSAKQVNSCTMSNFFTLTKLDKRISSISTSTVWIQLAFTLTTLIAVTNNIPPPLKIGFLFQSIDMMMTP